MTAVLRYRNDTTAKNLNAILDVLKSPATRSVTLYATQADLPLVRPDPDVRNIPYQTPALPGPDIIEHQDDLPFLAALATVTVPAIGEVEILFDGFFLTCARRSRCNEIETLLDAAIKNQNVSWGIAPVEFTSSLIADQAVSRLRHIDTVALNAENRSGFLALMAPASPAAVQRHKS